jgi:predicted nucleic acid-binding Zn ribbon protein
MSIQEWVAPSFVVLTWEEILESEGLQTIEDDPRHVPLEDTHGVRLPAQPVRDGGMFWHSRSDIFHSKQERNRREPVRFLCTECGKPTEDRKGSRFCSEKCQVRARVRRFRSKSVTVKLTKNGEETSQ